MRFRLRTLLIVLALGPPVVATTALPIFDWMTRKDLRSLEIAKHNHHGDALIRLPTKIAESNSD